MTNYYPSKHSLLYGAQVQEAKYFKQEMQLTEYDQREIYSKRQIDRNAHSKGNSYEFIQNNSQYLNFIKS